MFTGPIHTALPGTCNNTGEGYRKSMENGRPKSAIDFELGAFSSCIGFKINPYDPPRP
jgi:hypothetical protein